jgi:predicted CXXCH cytochrome family protein
MRLFWCIFFIASCVPSEPNIKQPIASQGEVAPLVGFSHEAHYQRKSAFDCTDCHSYSAKLSDFGRPAHEACESCHEKEFAGVDNKAFCESCHIEQSKSLQSFPRAGKGNLSLASFNHKSHLNPSADNFTRFGKSNCESCHNPNDNDPGSLSPGHKECNGCHGDSAGKNAAAPRLISQANSKDCLGCHTDVRR